MTQYKRNSSVLVGATLIALLVAGCEKNEPNVHELVGKWKYTSRTIYYGTSVSSPESSTRTPVPYEVLAFMADNTGSNTAGSFPMFSTTYFTWSASGSDLLLAFEEAGVSVTVQYIVTGNTLTLTGHTAADPDSGDPEQWQVDAYKKQ